MVEVVVIGAGAGGLAAAVALASAGREVVVVEASEEAGGKIGRGQHQGVSFDTGPSILTMPDVLDGLLRGAGTSLADELELVEASPVFRYNYADGVVLQIHHQVEETLGSVEGTLGAEAARELRAFLAYARGIWEEAAPAFVYGEAPTFGSVLKMGLRSPGRVRRIDPMRSMAGAIRSRVRDPHLRSLLLRYATYNGSDPRSAPATLNCIAHVELAGGGWGVRGGMYAVAEALERTARRLGVAFRYGSAVQEMVVEGDRAVGVEVDGALLRADAVVCNADVAHLVDDLLPEGATELDANYEPSMSGWTAVVRAAPVAERVAHQVIFPQDYLQEFRDIFEGRVAPSDPTVYLCAQDQAHLRPGWGDGTAPLFLMANAPAQPERGRIGRKREGDDAEDGAEEWAPLRARVLERAQAAGLLRADDEVVWERTPRELATRFPGSRGSIYGAASNSHLAAFKRPANRVAELAGLYLASGSAHPGGGVPLCLLSGREAARQVDEDLRKG